MVESGAYVDWDTIATAVRWGGMLASVCVIIYALWLLLRRVKNQPVLPNGEQRQEASIDTGSTIAIIYTLGFFGMVFGLMFAGLPPDNKDAINQLIGALTIIETAIITFFFGGSKSLDTQQVAMQQQQQKSVSALEKLAIEAPKETAKAVAAGMAAATGIVAPAAEVEADPAAWVQGFDYKVGDQVMHNNVAYLCAITHLSGLFDDDLTSGRWTVKIKAVV